MPGTDEHDGVIDAEILDERAAQPALRVQCVSVKVSKPRSVSRPRGVSLIGQIVKSILREHTEDEVRPFLPR